MRTTIQNDRKCPDDGAFLNNTKPLHGRAYYHCPKCKLRIYRKTNLYDEKIVRKEEIEKFVNA